MKSSSLVFYFVGNTMKYLFFLSCFIFAQGANLPVDFKTCRRSDPNQLKCVSENIEDALKKLEKGNKALGMHSLNPLKIKEMRGRAAGNAHVEEIYRDVELRGLVDSKLDCKKIDLDACIFELVSFSPLINIKSNYEMKGQFSVFTINGHGKSNQTIENFKIKHIINCEHYDKEGKTYIRVTNYQTMFEDFQLHLDYENLVPGNPVLSSEINTVLQENANELFSETKASHEKSYGELFKQLANTVFDKIPMDDIFPK